MATSGGLGLTTGLPVAEDGTCTMFSTSCTHTLMHTPTHQSKVFSKEMKKGREDKEILLKILREVPEALGWSVWL